MGQLIITTAELNTHLGKTFVEEEASAAFAVTGEDGTTLSYTAGTATVTETQQVLGNLIQALIDKGIV